MGIIEIKHRLNEYGHKSSKYLANDINMQIFFEEIDFGKPLKELLSSDFGT